MSVRSVTLTLRSSLRSAGIESTASSFAVVVAAQALPASVPRNTSMQSRNLGWTVRPVFQGPLVDVVVWPRESPSLSWQASPIPSWFQSACPALGTVGQLSIASGTPSPSLSGIDPIWPALLRGVVGPAGDCGTGTGMFCSEYSVELFIGLTLRLFITSAWMPVFGKSD